MYEGPQFRLKLVRYHESLPLHFVGVISRVQCSSAHTANSPAHPTQDKGWVALGYGTRESGTVGSAKEWAERERKKYLVIDEHTLVWTGNGVSVSFDACANFQDWSPTSLPTNLVVPIEKPDYCKPRGDVDCRAYDFQGERAPRFDHIQTAPTGKISFVMRSKALRDIGAIRVDSTDFGKTWKITAL